MAQLTLRQSLELSSDETLRSNFALHSAVFFRDKTDIASAEVAITAQMILNERAAARRRAGPGRS